MSRRLIGTVVDHEGALSLQTQPNCWFPLGGNSYLAHQFEMAFGPAQRGDIGKQVFRVNGVMQMENDEQRDARETNAHNPDVNPQWTPLIAYRIYACVGCGAEIKIQTNHNGACFAACAGKCRDIFNPHTAREKVQWHPTRKHVYIGEVK